MRGTQGDYSRDLQARVRTAGKVSLQHTVLAQQRTPVWGESGCSGGLSK